jgi:hypothetical protein
MGFSIENHPPFGDCFVVPGKEFDPDWEDSLADDGHACHNVFLKEKPVTLVEVAVQKLDDGEEDDGHKGKEKEESQEESPKETTTEKPVTKRKGRPPKPKGEQQKKEPYPKPDSARDYWPPEQRDYLVKVLSTVKRNQKGSRVLIINKMKQKFPNFNRSNQAVSSRIHNIRKQQEQERLRSSQQGGQTPLPEHPTTNLNLQIVIHVEAKDFKSVETILKLVKQLR